MKKLAYSLFLVLALPTVGVWAGTLTNGNASFTLLSPAWSNNFGNGTLLTDTGAADQLYRYQWYYRTQGNNTNRSFSSLDTPTESFVGDTATITYNNAGPGVSGAERFNAAFTMQLIDGAAPGEVRLNTILQFTASPQNSAARTYNLFNVVDFDLSAGAIDDSVQITNTSEVRGRFTEPGGNYGELLGLGATRFQAGAGTTVNNAASTGSTSLTNATGPYNGDGAIGLQWTFTLAPGESTTIYSGISLKSIATPEPTSLALLGLAGAFILGRKR